MTTASLDIDADLFPATGKPHYRYSWELGHPLQIILQDARGELFAVSLAQLRDIERQERNLIN